MNPAPNDPLGLLMQWITLGHPVSGAETMLSCHRGKIWALSAPKRPIPNRPISQAEAKEYLAEGLLAGHRSFVSELNHARKARGLKRLPMKTVLRQLSEHDGRFLEDMTLDASPDAGAEALLDALDAGGVLSVGGREGSLRYRAISDADPVHYERSSIGDDGRTKETLSRLTLGRQFESQLSRRPGPGLPSRPQYFLDQALKHLGHETVRQYVRSTTAVHTLEQTVLAASRKFWETDDRVRNVLHPWAAADSGFVQTNELEISDAVEEILREGTIPEW